MWTVASAGIDCFAADTFGVDEVNKHLMAQPLGTGDIPSFEFLEGLSLRLRQQIEFLTVVDRLKEVQRRTYIVGGNRRENSAEHSWHAALAALVLAEWGRTSNGGLDLAKVVQMLLVHDIVEVEAGDTFVYDEHLEPQKKEVERQAAERLFSLLPPDQAVKFRSLWDEFEARQTREAQFAAAIDRILPILLNFVNRGRLWQENGIDAGKVRRKNAHIREGSEKLWDLAATIIDEAVARGFLVATAEC
ncbi:MAG: HD domain-containing protein [Thermoguttaceae bacterium]|nr:HD domain-containing protein [Thermoguttaceae bacterium]MDW8078458.1 HD domain-containing protein [Thermoguttaceae bacterium]